MKRKHTELDKRWLAAAVAPTLLLMACGASNASADAKTLIEADAIYVDGEKCRDGVTSALSEYNLGVTDSPDKADSTLTLEVTSLGRNLDDVPEFGGFGHQASYSATLTGDANKVLFSTSGEEGSTTQAEMCEDIGDEIAARIKERRTG